MLGVSGGVLKRPTTMKCVSTVTDHPNIQYPSHATIHVHWDKHRRRIHTVADHLRMAPARLHSLTARCSILPGH